MNTSHVDGAAFCEKLIAETPSKEALARLQGPESSAAQWGFTLGEAASIEESREMVREIYDLGAGRVVAVEIDEYPEGQNTGKIVIERPDEATARNQLFGWSRNQAEELGFDGEIDTGRKYIFVMID